MAVGFIAYFAIINAVTFAAFTLDKRAAERGQWRVPESALFTLGAMGGSPAGLVACHVLRHKIRKPGFAGAFWAILGIQSAIAGYAAYRLM